MPTLTELQDFRDKYKAASVGFWAITLIIEQSLLIPKEQQKQTVQYLREAIDRN